MSSPSLKAPVKASVGSSAGKKHVCESFEKWKRRVWMNKGRHKRMEWIWSYIEAQKSFFSAAVVFLFFVGWLLQWKSTDRGVVALVDAALDGVLLEAVGKRWSVMCVVPTSCYLAFRSCSDASMLCTCSMRAGSSYSRSVCGPVVSTYLDADAAGPSALFGDHSQERASRCCPEAEVRVFGLGATHV